MSDNKQLPYPINPGPDIPNVNMNSNPYYPQNPSGK